MTTHHLASRHTHDPGDVTGLTDALAAKVDETAVATRVYATDGAGAQTVVPYSSGSPTAFSLMYRGTGGVSAVGTPVADNHATTKLYVDTLAAAKVDITSLPYVDARRYGATGDGSTNDTAALQAALNATPDGGILRIPPGRYLVRAVLLVTGKSITIEAEGAILVQDADVDVLRISGTFETIYDVSALTPTTITVDASVNVPALTLTTSGSTGWVRGDLVKLVSDDPIPDARPTDTTAKCRLGQFLYVRDVSGTSVTLIGALHDPMSTNLRISRLPKTTARISGLRIESTNVTDWTGGGLKLFNLYAPQVDVRYGQMSATLTSLRSCYRPNLTVIADGGNSDPTNGKLAYAVLDTGSEGGQFNVNAGSVRHAYTDGSNLVEPGSTNIRDYGRPYGHIVTGQAQGTLSSAWDTHSTGMNITFADCVATHCANAFSLRGRYNNIFNGVAYSCRGAFLLQDEPRLGQDAKSFGHTIDGLVLHDTPGIFFRSNWEDATAPGYNTRVTIPTTMRNVTMDAVSALYGIQILNQTVRLENIRLVAAATVPDTHTAITVANGDLVFRDVDLNYLDNTAGATLKAIETTVDSVVRGSGLRWSFSSDTAARISKVLIGTSGTSWDVKDTDLSFNIIPGSLGLAGSRFDYSAQATGHNMAWLGSSNSSIDGTGLPLSASISRNPVVYIRASPTDANRSLAKLQPGSFRGQRLSVANTATTGGFTVTVNHGSSSWLTANTGAAAVAIPNGQSAWWTWDGTLWRQEEDALTRAALDLKAPLASPAFTGTPTGITKTHVGLSAVDNTSDAAKPVSTATQTALNLKAPLASPAFTGTPTGITKVHVGLGNSDNTADNSKPVSTAQQAAIDAVAVNASAYTDAAVAALVDSSPATMDTLNELAAALGDDPNFATTVATNIGLKADKSVTVSAGTGLTGGGNLSANRTLAVSYGSSAGTAAQGNDSRLSDARTPTAHVHSTSEITGLDTALTGKALKTTTVSAGTGLTGGGDLSANRTLSVAFGTSSSTACVGNDARLSDTRTPTASSITTAMITAATLVTAAEGVGSNNNDTTLPTSAAVKTYVDARTIVVPVWYEVHSTYGARVLNSYGDNTMGFLVADSFTLTGVVYRGETADASGSSTFEIRKNGTQISGTSKAITAANQWGYDSDVIVTGLSVSLVAGDIIRPYITAVGTTPGNGLGAVLIGTKTITVS